MALFGNSQIDRLHRGGGLNFLGFLSITPLFDNMRRELKLQWFGLWFQTKISITSCTNRSLVDHILSMSSIVISDPITSLSTYSNTVGSCYGLFLELWGILLPPGSLLGPKSEYYRYLPRGTPWCALPGWLTKVHLNFLNTSQLFLGIGALWNPTLWE